MSSTMIQGISFTSTREGWRFDLCMWWGGGYVDDRGVLRLQCFRFLNLKQNTETHLHITREWVLV